MSCEFGLNESLAGLKFMTVEREVGATPFYVMLQRVLITNPVMMSEAFNIFGVASQFAQGLLTEPWAMIRTAARTRIANARVRTLHRQKRQVG